MERQQIILWSWYFGLLGTAAIACVTSARRKAHGWQLGIATLGYAVFVPVGGIAAMYLSLFFDHSAGPLPAAAIFLLPMFGVTALAVLVAVACNMVLLFRRAKPDKEEGRRVSDWLWFLTKIYGAIILIVCGLWGFVLGVWI